MAKRANNKYNDRKPNKNNGYKGQRRPRSKRSATTQPEVEKSFNEVLGKFTSQMSKSTSIIFPESCMSMQALGNPVSSPGQDNFIEAWNTIFAQDATPGRPTINFIRPNDKRIPNAMIFDVCPYFGATAAQTIQGSMSDPLQIAATNLKQFIDTSFGTVTSYDSQDLMLYLMAISAVYPLIAEIKRDLRLALTYQEDVYPQFVPRGMFIALKISDDQGNYLNGEGAIHTAKFLRSYVSEFNQVLFQFNQLPVPPEMALFRYNDDLWDYIYADSPDYKTAQLYAFRLTEYWSYEETAEPYPMIKPNPKVDPRSVGDKIENLRNMVNKLTALQTSSTAMLQNLYNAYGSKDLVKVETLEEVTPLEVRYDENMLISIDNMVIWEPEHVGVTTIVANPVTNRCEGHVYSFANEIQSCVNFPLQFHKAYSDVTKEDIGYAMRFHPSLRTWKSFDEYDGSTVSRQTSVTADGYTGFAIIRKAIVYTLADDGSLAYNTLTPNSNGWGPVALDFKACPILLNATRDGEDLNVYAYTARRDVEVTYRLEDIRMFWTYLTGILYGSDLNRNFTGTRIR